MHTGTLLSVSALGKMVRFQTSGFCGHPVTCDTTSKAFTVLGVSSTHFAVWKNRMRTKWRRALIKPAIVAIATVYILLYLLRTKEAYFIGIYLPRHLWTERNGNDDHSTYHFPLTRISNQMIEVLAVFGSIGRRWDTDSRL